MTTGATTTPSRSGAARASCRVQECIRACMHVMSSTCFPTELQGCIRVCRRDEIDMLPNLSIEQSPFRCVRKNCRRRGVRLSVRPCSPRVTLPLDTTAWLTAAQLSAVFFARPKTLRRGHQCYIGGIQREPNSVSAPMAAGSFFRTHRNPSRGLSVGNRVTRGPAWAPQQDRTSLHGASRITSRW